MVDSDFIFLQDSLLSSLPREGGAFALAGMAKHGQATDVLIRRAVRVPDDLFKVRTNYRLEIAPEAVNGLAALCEKNRLGAVLCHSHPVDSPYSPSDDHGEQRVFETLRAFIPDGAPLASLLFFPGGVRGRMWCQRERTFISLDCVTVVGRQLTILSDSGDESIAPTIDRSQYDRQIRAFGQEGQAAIARAKVGVVGVGATGSASAEQLVRLGVQDIVLIDPDWFEPSNVTRAYGTFPIAGGNRWWRRPQRRRKVDLIAQHLRRISPNATITALAENVVLRHAAASLLDRDIIMLCTDDHWGRSIVNQVAYQYLIPVINMGVRITSEHGTIVGGNGSVDVLRPGKPCLWCSGFLRAERVAAESTPGAQRRLLQAEGYIEDLESPSPSVVSLTTTVSGLAVTEFLQLLTDFMGERGDITRLNFDPMEGTVRRGQTASREQCVCKDSKGFGDLRPLHTLPDLSHLEDQAARDSVLGRRSIPKKL
jgi:molybdopterin/thiamine biosynthesis adenylyltransferase